MLTGNTKFMTRKRGWLKDELKGLWKAFRKENQRPDFKYTGVGKTGG